jgi:hypothetical protein
MRAPRRTQMPSRRCGYHRRSITKTIRSTEIVRRRCFRYLRSHHEIVASTLFFVHASFTFTFLSSKPYATQLTYRGIYSRLRSARTYGTYIYFYPVDKRVFVLLFLTVHIFLFYSLSVRPRLSLAWTPLCHPHYKLYLWSPRYCLSRVLQ